MKLVRYGNAGSERPGVIGSDGGLHDLSMLLREIDGAALAPRTLDALALLDIDRLPRVDGAVRYGCLLASIGKVVCVGLNYADHAAESGSPIPSEPVLFLKANTSVSGPNDDVIIPRGSQKTDWEVELGVVIGQTARYVSEDEALQFVAGYTVVNDVSERAFQLEQPGEGSGTRARAATPSRRSVRGWSRATRCSTRTGSISGSKSMTSACRTAIPGS